VVKICCLGDIHYWGSTRVRLDLEKLAENIIKSYCEDVDVVVIVGDITSSGILDHVLEALTIIKSRGVGCKPILIVPGNHDIYLTMEEMKNMDSLVKLRKFNDFIDSLTGFVALMNKPYIIDGVGFVGSIGWYDYSFAPSWAGLTIHDYKRKSLGIHMWADKYYVKLPFSDEEFTNILVDQLEKHIKQIYNKVDKIVAVLHHVPFRELVEYRGDLQWDYFSTYMGSEKFGQLIKKYRDKINLVLHGHQHGGNVKTRTCRNIEGIKCCNCASPIPIIVNT